MAVWSVVDFAALSEDMRFDAEYYRPEVLALRDAIDKTRIPVKTIGELAASVINFGAYSLCNDIVFQESEERDADAVEFVTAQDIQDGFIDFANARWISDAQHQGLLWKSQVTKHQVLVAMAARLGHAAVYAETRPLNSSQDIAKIKVANPEHVDPFYLATYINATVGRQLLLAAQTGSVQQHTNLARIKSLRVVVAPRAVQREVAELYGKALQVREDATARLLDAENLLADALGLSKLDISERLFYERTFADIQMSQRLDAEYFSPRYQQALTALSKDGRCICDVADLVERRFRPERFGNGETFNYIEIGSVRDDGLANAETVEVSQAPSRAQWVVEPDDIITSTVRPIRRLSALITPQQSGYVCSSGFAVLRPRRGPDGIESEVLLTYLRLPFVCEILDLHTTASMYPAISTARLMTIPIAVPTQSVRNEIVAKIRNAFSAREQAARLLGEAKSRVDRAVLAGSP